MENLFLDVNAERGRICLIDWQTPKSASILGTAYELVQHLSRNVSVSILENSDDLYSLIEFYYTILRAELSSPALGELPSLDDFKAMVERVSVFALVNVILLGATLTFPPPESVDLKSKRHLAVFERSLALVRHFSPRIN